MAGTIAQEIQYKLTNTQLRATLFAVQLEAARYKDLPKEDLPIEVATLLRARSRLANFVHGIGEPETLLMHEWEIFSVAVRQEMERFEQMPSRFRPQYIRELDEAILTIESMLDASRSQVSR